MDLNKIIGLFLFALGAITFIICLAAFVKVAFAKESRKAGEGLLEQINALLNVWLNILKIIPKAFRHIFLLLLFGVLLMGAGYYILAYKPL
jgi:hypothetical protein